MEHIVTSLPIPPILQVILSHLWVILEAISIAIMLTPVVFKVCQQFRTKVFVTIDMDISISICLKFTHRITIKINRHTCWIFWFNVLYVYLTSHCLIAILNR